MADKLQVSKKSNHRNPVLAPGVHRFGRSTSYHKKGIWIKRKNPAKKPIVAKKELTREKQIGGDKNGKVRRVVVTKSKKYHPTAVGKKTTLKRVFESKTRLRGSLKPGTICILLAGRHAGKKAIVVKTFDEGTKDREFGHCLVAGIERNPRKVTKTHSKKAILKRSKIKPFVKFVNYNHIMPTRYTVSDIDLKTAVTSAALKKLDTKEETKKEVKKPFESRYLTRGKNTSGVQYFFTKLRF